MVRAPRVAAIVLIGFLAAGIPAQAGHESNFYPSYYPQEIRLQTVDPVAAPALLQQAAIHAFIGPDLFPHRPIPSNLGVAESLGAYVVLTVNTAQERYQTPERRCALVKRVMDMLADDQGRYIFSPYPVTPYDRDYLEHVDIVARAKQAALANGRAGGEAGRLDIAVTAQGPLAEEVVRAHWRPTGVTWDVQLASIDVADLLAAHSTDLGLVAGPPWLKDGWFHAYLLMADAVSDRRMREEIDHLYLQLTNRDYQRPEDKVALARTLVMRLQRGCERAVVGYTTQRAYYNVEYSPGVENVGFDSHFGLASPIFVRTAKLKDFIWNGQLRIGVATAPSSAWNPVGGFRDAYGRTLWAAVGDTAVLPGPSSGPWIPNRVTFRTVEDASWWGGFRRVIRTLRGGAPEQIAVPADAVLPAPGSGRLVRVGPGKWAGAKIEYRVLASAFHDGTAMTTVDALYPFVAAYRWSDDQSRHYDVSIAQATARLRAHLVGIRPVRTDTVIRDLGGDLKLKYDVPVIEIYLDSARADPVEAALTALPWSTVPWHLMTLLEAGVEGGIGAFSVEEAARQHLPWLDVVRAPQAKERLGQLLETFVRQRYVPESLEGRVTHEEAAVRWRALQDFARRYGHLLVTNGPYRLGAWGKGTARLDVFRDLSYPLGVGSFDRYVQPRRGYITGVDVAAGRLTIHAEVERIIKFERTFRIVRERLGSNTTGAIDTVSPMCRYLVVAADGRIVKDGTAIYGSGGIYTVDVSGVERGDYHILVAIFLNENFMNPEVKIVPYTRP